MPKIGDFDKKKRKNRSAIPMTENSPSHQLYRDLGFRAMSRPVGEAPHLPTRISGVTASRLGDMQVEYAAWREYTEDLHADALSAWAQIKSEYDFLVAVTSNGLDARTVKDKTNLVMVNPKVREKSQKLLDASTLVDLLAAKLASYTNALQVLSRELTRRGLINV